MPVEPRDREEPRPAVEPVLRAHRPRIDPRPELRRGGAERHDPHVRSEGGTVELAQHRARELRRPAADGDHHRTAAEQLARRPALEGGSADLRLEEEELRPVHDDAIREPDAGLEPARGVAGGLELAAPREAGPGAPGERTRPGGPHHEPVDGPEPRRPDGGMVDRLRELRVARGAAGMAAGRDDQGVGGIAQRQLAHQARDAAPERRKIEREEQRAGQATTSDSMARRSRTTRSQLK